MMVERVGVGAVEWTGALKTAFQNGLAYAGYRVVNIERLEARLAEKMEAVTRLFERAEGCAVPPNARRAGLLFELEGTTVLEALFIVRHLHRSLRFEGDVCEFGVAQGATSALLANEITATDRHIWLFDSFQGLPEATEKDEFVDRRSWLGAMRSPRTLVERRLRDIGFPKDRIHIIPGFFPESAKDAAPDRIAFAYVDFDLYRPIIDALRFVDERLASGATVIVDDYNHPQFPGARKAVDEFVSETRFTIDVPAYEKFAILTKP